MNNLLSQQNRRIFLAVCVILTVLLVKEYSGEINSYLFGKQASLNVIIIAISQLLYYLVPAIIILLLFHKPSALLKELGLGGNFLEGIKFAFLFTLPMLVGYMLLGKYDSQHSVFSNILMAFKDGSREEIFYRAFLFGQLFRHAKWGFIPAAAINGVIFGLSHLYQAKDVGESVGIFAITLSGAVWFAWLFIEWEENLWLPIGMHFLMNFYWDLFNVSDNAMGGLILNIPRILTIALSIIITTRMIRKRKYKHVSRHTLWINQEVKNGV
jgi:CAAX protease family protein